MRKEIAYIIDEKGCYICTSHISPSHVREKKGKDYPHVQRGGKKYRLNRYVYEQKYGSIPKGLVVMHICDNTRCINIDHLRLGTQQENLSDCRLKDRHIIGRKGEDSLKAKLTENDVRSILQSDDNYKDIAKYYGVCGATIWDILNHRTWKHISEE